MTDYFLGIDGGQSSTIAMVGDASGRIVGWASGGPSNHVAAPEARAKFLRVIGTCLTQASTQAGIGLSIDSHRLHFRAACLGMSGGPEDKAALLHELLDAEHLIVTHDARIALAGATGGQPGVVVIAGTGSIAFGENGAGETARAGGWGYIFGDEGGGFDIVRQALRAVLGEHEGWGPRTALTPALLEATGTANANETLHRLYTPEWPRSRVAALAPLVDRIAAAGDPIATAILNNAAHHLATLAGSVRRQLWREGEPSALSWAGGVFNSAILRERFRMLAQLDDTVAASPPQHSPAVGALLIAWRAAGLQPSPIHGTGVNV
ncbi:MAG: BadF/BadG/BcrA/BcrD ATPase family protein [Bryobacteraceae bacterium]|jgi:N-acetylglucosamine kinase-like BadF-type ATPase